MKDCYLGIYWNKRQESIDECVQKVFKTLSYLRDVNKSFIEWYQTSKPKKGQLVTAIHTDYYATKNLLEDGRNYNDDGTLNEDIGYSIYLKSCKDFSKSHVLSVTCGCYNERLSNSVVLNFSKAEEYSYLIDRSQLLPIYRKLVEIWGPERGIIKCHDEDVPILSEFYN